MKYLYILGAILVSCFIFIVVELFINNDKVILSQNISATSQVEETGPEFMPSPFYHLPVDKEELNSLIEKDKLEKEQKEKEEAKKQEDLAAAKKIEEEKSSNSVPFSIIPFPFFPPHYASPFFLLPLGVCREAAACH